MWSVVMSTRDPLDADMYAVPEHQTQDKYVQSFHWQCERW